MDFFSLSYIIGVTFSCLIYFSYLFDSTCTISAARGPLSQVCIILSKSACMHSPCNPHVIMLLFYLVLIMKDRNIYSVTMSSELVSSLFLYTICFLWYTHPWTLTLLHRFSSGTLDIWAPTTRNHQNRAVEGYVGLIKVRGEVTFKW